MIKLWTTATLILLLISVGTIYIVNPSTRLTDFYGQAILADGKLVGNPAETQEVPLYSGDIIFHTSRSSQSKAIQLATKSIYSHCGILFKEGGAIYVLEARQPVKRTPLKAWISRGENGSYVIKRLKETVHILTPADIQKMKQIGESFEGKDYDGTFEWTDDRIYCSELIWKIYERAVGLELGGLEKLDDFDLSNVVVKNKLKERYGNKIPKKEIVISPQKIFDSPLLETILRQ